MHPPVGAKYTHAVSHLMIGTKFGVKYRFAHSQTPYNHPVVAKVTHAAFYKNQWVLFASTMWAKGRRAQVLAGSEY